MKRKIIIASITLFLLISKGEGLHAQTITITDTAFASYLRFKIPAAMNGSQLDTGSSLVKHLTNISVINKGISNLNGVQYFTSLDTLITIYNNLTTLPTLPNNLTYLLCVNCSLTSLPALPNSLKQLTCSGNLFTSLPTLPDSLLILWCEGGALTSLPLLPNSIQQINCSSNSLKSLPKLPTSLTLLWCSYNQLTNLPALPNSLAYLLCKHNNISCFPFLPNTIKSLDISYNPFTCLPNYINAMDSSNIYWPPYPNKATFLALPLCNLDNPNGCPASTDLPTQLIIPNIFTPNGDNLNDEFFIKASNLTNFNCKIYNRWGVLIYQFDNINSAWNGKDKSGESATDGTYYYVVSYTDNTNKANTKNGFFQLIK